MRIIKCEPMKAPVICDINNDLDTLHEIVGGYIEVVPIGRDALMICNEEGKLHDEFIKNRLLVRFDGSHDMIHGTFIIVADGGDDFASLTDDDVDCWLYRLDFDRNLLPTMN